MSVKTLRRAFWILLVPIVALGSFLLTVHFFVLPRLASVLLTEIQKTTEQNTEYHLKMKALEMSLFPLRAQIKEATLEPKKPNASLPIHISLGRAAAHVSLFHLLLGRTEIISVDLNDLAIDLPLDPLLESDGPPQKLPLKSLFSTLEKVPLKDIHLTQGQIQLKSQIYGLSGNIDVSDILVENKRTVLQLTVAGNIKNLTQKDFSLPPLVLKTSATLGPKDLVLNSLSLSHEDISIRLHGHLLDFENIAINPRGQLTAETSIPLASASAMIEHHPAAKKIPSLQGSLQANANIELNGSFLQPNGTLSADLTNGKIGPFVLGDARLKIHLKKDNLQIDRVEFHHPAGEASIQDAQIALNSDFPFKGKVDISRLDLQKLFQGLDLHKIPVDANLKGHFLCDGELRPLELRCDGDADGDRLQVRGDVDPKAKTIVELADLAAKGDFSLNLENIQFQAQLRVGKAKGETRGQVSFENGFRIDYRAPQIDFKDVKNLANLSFAGQIGLEGRTEGNADTATFGMKLSAQNFVFENFTLGAVSGLLRYQGGNLYFDDLKQNLGRSQLKGGFVLDLRHDTIDGTIRAEALDAADIPVIFSKIWQFPLDIQGNGVGQAKFSGPLSLWAMTYQLTAGFQNGRLQGDAFDRFDLNLVSNDGDLHIAQAELKKNQSIVRAKGGISPKQEMNIGIEAIGLRLEESDFINRIRGQVAGQFNASAQLTGFLQNPDFKLQGSLSDIYVDEQDIPSSFFRLHLNRRLIEGESTLFGNKIQGDFYVPLTKDNSNPLKIRLKTLDWPFSGLLALLGASTLQTEYESALTTDVELSSDNGRLESVSGKINIRDFYLKRGAFFLRNPHPSQILLDKGTLTLKNMRLEGSGAALIDIQGEHFRLDNLGVGIQAKTDLKLVHMLVPFLEDLGGPFQISANIGGSIFKPQILGNAAIQDGYIKIKGFPHPVEKLKLDVVFSHSKILLQNIQGILASGSLAGDGAIQMNGIRDVPINIRMRADGLNLNVPDKVRTSGDADLSFTGTWFPFVLSGNYRIKSGLVEMEFGGDSNSSSNSRTSIYLPKLLRQANFDPVILDLNAQIEKPLRVKNSQMDGFANGHLQVKGPPQNPILIGRITTEKGSRIMVKDKPFELTTGVINFTDPTEVNPELYLSAQARVEQYDVNVLVQGTAKSPSIRMSSTPPLSEQDIVSLLALGITSQQLDGSVQSKEQAAQLGYEALGLGLSKTGISKGLESTTGINLQITSSFDNTKNISVPKLQLNRKISERLNAVYSRPLAGDQNAQEVKMQYRINSNVSAVGSYEERASQEGAGLTDSGQGKSSVLGLDLEFKREFK